MKQQTQPRLVAQYLRALDRAMMPLSREQARELREQIAGHLQDTIGPEPTDVQIRNAINRLGSPEQVVAEVLVSPPTPTRARWIDVLAVLMLSAGSLLLPVLGWLIGIILIRSSPRFTRSQKIAALTLWPLGLLGPAAAGFLSSGVSLTAPWGASLAVVLFAVPLVVVGWLIQSLGR